MLWFDLGRDADALPGRAFLQFSDLLTLRKSNNRWARVKLGRMRLTRTLALAAIIACAAAGAAAASKLSQPQLLSLRYGHFQPKGNAHAYYGFELSVKQTGGQIMSTELEVLPQRIGLVGTSTCGAGGRRSGQTETTYLSLPGGRRLAKGRYQVLVTAVGASCSGSGAISTGEHTFKVTVS